MNYLRFHINEITKTDFRSYLILKNDETKWFYWHLSSNLKNYKLFDFHYKNNLIGVFCFKRDSKTLVDLYIDKPFRRMGFGELLIKNLNSSYPNLEFKVNYLNRNSIDFFDSILLKGIITKKVVNKDCYIYTT
ncbi:hypothetical protein OAF04_00025 [Flavobacteriaceae bacterium]|nr:hypothetical protein [Flavobacteriaceae bacterium]